MSYGNYRGTVRELNWATSSTALVSLPFYRSRFMSARSSLPPITRWPFVVLAVAMASYSSPASAAGLLIADGGFGGVLEIKEQDVKVTINNGVAVTEVEQVFINKENRIVEALYTFPVPRGASVANFSMWINGKEMIGEVVEKERARQ